MSRVHWGSGNCCDLGKEIIKNIDSKHNYTQRRGQKDVQVFRQTAKQVDQQTDIQLEVQPDK